MAELLSRFSHWELIGFLAAGGALFIPVVAIVGALWADVRKAELAAALKHDMLDRGLSAEEIQAVLNAGKKRAWKQAREAHKHAHATLNA
jgi:hypothetical protein